VESGLPGAAAAAHGIWASIAARLGPDWRTRLATVEYKGGVQLEIGMIELQKRELWRWPAFIKAVETCEAFEGVKVLEVNLQRRSDESVPEFQDAAFKILVMTDKLSHGEEKE
jgi:hypothetical protein